MEPFRPRLKHADDPKEPNTVRFVCLSDTHNVTDYLSVPAGDVLLHAGDFTRQGDPSDVAHFNRFLASLRFQHKVVIAGNHDMTFDTENFLDLKARFRMKGDVESIPTKALLTDCTYLEDSETTVFGYRIWGSPWTPTFFNWGFNLDIGPAIDAKWQLIPSGIDILITHGPPYQVLDRTSGKVEVGCPMLLRKVRELRPIVHLFGHIHETYGTVEHDGTLFINGSTCNLRYKAVNAPIIFDLPVRG